jgi:hypothetical protein
MAVTVTTTLALVMQLGLSAILGVVLTAALILLLVQREVGVAMGARTQTFVRGLSIAIPPLMLTFVFIIVRRLVSLF